jgi:hypothetical protein
MKWEHCCLIGRKVSYLGADRLFEDKRDAFGSDRAAWDVLEKNGWELVAVAPNKAGELAHFFKRRLEE